MAAPPAKESPESSSGRMIEYLSKPAAVSMADKWFEIASTEHFWIRRRFEVLQKVAGKIISEAKEMAEIGCGHGLLQRQIEVAYHQEVTGFDLNEFALRHNVSQRSRVYCYDIFQSESTLSARFDVIFLFDVLEHISDEDSFLQAILFHLAPGGKLIVNVPAGRWAYSSYDVAVGHLRRYSLNQLREIGARNHLTALQGSYWGLPLVPTLLARKLWLLGKKDKGKIITAGMDSRTPGINGALRMLSKCEWVPQEFLGTSVMAVFDKRAS